MEQIKLNLVSEIEIGYKSKIPASQRPQITMPVKAYQIFKAHWDENKIELVEQAKLLLLNKASKVLGILDLSTGGIVQTSMDLRIIFVTALKANAVKIMIAHNHPSGNLQPSGSDISITKQVHEAGKLLQIELIDHLIITTEGYYSMKDEGDF